MLDFIMFTTSLDSLENMLGGERFVKRLLDLGLATYGSRRWMMLEGGF